MNVKDIFLEEILKQEQNTIERVKKELYVVYDEYIQEMQTYTEQFKKKYKVKGWEIDRIILEDPNKDSEEIYNKWESQLQKIQSKIEKKHNNDYIIEHEEYGIFATYFHGDYSVKYSDGNCDIQLGFHVEKALEATINRLNEVKSADSSHN